MIKIMEMMLVKTVTAHSRTKEGTKEHHNKYKAIAVANATEVMITVWKTPTTSLATISDD